MKVLFTAQEQCQIRRAFELLPDEIDIEYQLGEGSPEEDEAHEILRGLWHALRAAQILTQDDQKGRYFVWDISNLRNMEEQVIQAPVEKDETPFEVLLVRDGQPQYRKLRAIKAFRDAFKIPLKDAKGLVDQVPTPINAPAHVVLLLKEWLEGTGYELVWQEEHAPVETSNDALSALADGFPLNFVDDAPDDVIVRWACCSYTVSEHKIRAAIPVFRQMSQKERAATLGLSQEEYEESGYKMEWLEWEHQQIELWNEYGAPFRVDLKKRRPHESQ